MLGIFGFCVCWEFQNLCLLGISDFEFAGYFRISSLLGIFQILCLLGISDFEFVGHFQISSLLKFSDFVCWIAELHIIRTRRCVYIDTAELEVLKLQVEVLTIMRLVRCFEYTC